MSFLDYMQLESHFIPLYYATFSEVAFVTVKYECKSI